MQNINELIEKLTDNYLKMEKGERPIKLGRELSNTADKIIGALSVKLRYNQFQEDREKIDFLESYNQKTL